MTISYMQN